MREDLNEKYDKYKYAILKLLDEALIEGETLIGIKSKDGVYTYIKSEERLSFNNTDEEYLITGKADTIIINEDGKIVRKDATTK